MFSSRWWEKDPNILALFPQYKDKPLTELKLLPRVRAHGSHIFLAITGVLLNLETEAVTSELLDDLKRDHVQFQPTLSAESYTVCYIKLCSKLLMMLDLKPSRLRVLVDVGTLCVQKYSHTALAYLTTRLGAGMTPLAVSGFTKLLTLMGTEGVMHN